MLSALRNDAGAGDANADRLAIQHLTMLMLTGFACTLLILTFLILASFQAVSMIDAGVRTRETLQVARAVAATPGGMNEVALDAIADTLDLEAARLTSFKDVKIDELSVALAVGSDQVVAWHPHLFGTRTFETVAPVRIGAGIFFTLIVAVIGWRMVVVGYRLDRRRAVATRLANTDTLTGLGNRRAFDEGLATRYAAAAAGDEGFVMISLDLDGFKAINDAFGHSVGDAVLQLVGQHLRETSRPGDLVTRLGGDEFAVLRSGADLDSYMGELRARMMQPLDLNGRRLHVSASIGMARSDDFPGSASQLTQAADIALYRAKRSGPGNAELAVPTPKVKRAA